ncbi:hypothetical protein, partial [Vibrio anguillarum]|uniref:hypothetical protein n=1 Tax=Vibrio anguillarum TaxID=55601 RepID=UPI001BE49243
FWKKSGNLCSIIIDCSFPEKSKNRIKFEKNKVWKMNFPDFVFQMCKLRKLVGRGGFFDFFLSLTYGRGV